MGILITNNKNKNYDIYLEVGEYGNFKVFEYFFFDSDDDFQHFVSEEKKIIEYKTLKEINIRIKRWIECQLYIRDSNPFAEIIETEILGKKVNLCHKFSKVDNYIRFAQLLYTVTSTTIEQNLSILIYFIDM